MQKSVIALSPPGSGRDRYGRLQRGMERTRDGEGAGSREDDGLLVATFEVYAVRAVESTGRAARGDKLAAGANDQVVRAASGVVDGDGVADFDGDTGGTREGAGPHGNGRTAGTRATAATTGG